MLMLPALGQTLGIRAGLKMVTADEMHSGAKVFRWEGSCMEGSAPIILTYTVTDHNFSVLSVLDILR